MPQKKAPVAAVATHGAEAQALSGNVGISDERAAIQALSGIEANSNPIFAELAIANMVRKGDENSAYAAMLIKNNTELLNLAAEMIQSDPKFAQFGKSNQGVISLATMIKPEVAQRQFGKLLDSNDKFTQYLTKVDQDPSNRAGLGGALKKKK